jgi:hypothetical protein
MNVANKNFAIQKNGRLKGSDVGAVGPSHASWNPARRHSALGWSPIAYEGKMLMKA